MTNLNVVPTHPLYNSPQKERNEEKYGYLDNQCICCGKPMKNGNSKWVHLNINLDAVHNAISDTDCERLTGFESQGCFQIGNDCAKKMPKEYILEDAKIV